MRRTIFLVVIAAVCNIVCSRNWNVIADSICLKQKMFIDSMLLNRKITSQEIRGEIFFAFDKYCELRKSKRLIKHFENVSHDNDTLFFIEHYKPFQYSGERTIFWVKSDNWRGLFLYTEGLGMTSNWEYIYTSRHLMNLCKEWDIERVKELEQQEDVYYADRGETCFIRLVILPDDKFKVDVFYFDDI